MIIFQDFWHDSAFITNSKLKHKQRFLHEYGTNAGFNVTRHKELKYSYEFLYTRFLFNAAYLRAQLKC